MHTHPLFYCVYLLQLIPRSSSFYIGSTPDPVKRLRQHNGTISSGGAVRTKNIGKRPWLMVACIGRFPSKIAALQFESALQHPYQTRHIPRVARVSSSYHSAISIHHKIANIRLLVSSPYFAHMHLKVYLFNSAFEKKWVMNKFNIDDVPTLSLPFDSFFNSKLPQSLHFIVNLDIAHISSLASTENHSCAICDSLVVPKLLAFSCSCGSFYHFACLLSASTEINHLVPKSAKCVTCSNSWPWPYVARIATNARAVANNDHSPLTPYNPDEHLLVD